MEMKTWVGMMYSKIGNRRVTRREENELRVSKVSSYHNSKEGAVPGCLGDPVISKLFMCVIIVTAPAINNRISSSRLSSSHQSRGLIITSIHCSYTSKFRSAHVLPQE